jgi:hypothetical protein
MNSPHTRHMVPTIAEHRAPGDPNLPTGPTAPGRLPALRRLFARRPVAAAIGIALTDAAVVVLAGAGAKAALPRTAHLADFVAMGAGILLLVAALTALGWWGRVGFNRPAAWRDLRCYLLPAAVGLLLPFAAGGHLISPGTAAFFVLSYALTGFYEEGLNRGLILTVLRPAGTKCAVFLSAALFGASHLVKLLFRNPFVVALQAIGAFTEGVGFAALRLRTNTLWPLLALHCFDDLLLHYSNLPVIPLHAVQTTICMTFGLFLLRGTRRRGGEAADELVPAIAPAAR